MVLESVAEIVLSRLLDKVFYGISKKNIQVELLDGKFVLSNIGLQPSLLAELNLPIELKYSYVERVEIHLPWRKDEVSLTVNISNIYLLAATSEHALDLYEIFLKRKEQIVEQALKEFKSNL
jgi:vacuolar protein sorting-associated protein 13A/C